MDRIRSWVINSDEKQKNKPRWEDPIISVQQVKEQIKELNDKVKKIMSKPAPAPPAPPQVQEKKEEKKP